MKNSMVVLMILINGSLWGQVHPSSIVVDFYKDLNIGDSSTIRSYFTDDAVILHINEDTSFQYTIDEFMYATPMFKSKKYQEELLYVDMTLPASFMGYSVVSEFKFFYNGKEHHCGQDIFFIHGVDSMYQGNLIYIPKVFKVVSIEGPCWEKPDTKVEKERKLEEEKADAIRLCGNIITQWHEDAAEANFEGYFEVMADSFYFLGTDPDERWSKEAFADFCKPYFDKGTTWYFEAEKRNLAVSEDGNVVWFDEYLFTTNMDYCRGSGVLQKVDNEWKLFHYNLTVLIENEKMKKFLKLRKK